MRKAFRIGLFCLATALIMPATPVYAQCVNPAGNEGDMAFNETYNVAQYCDNAGWVAMISPESPPDCPDIGDVCADGTVYAGLSPDGNVKMYTTASDIGTSRWASAGEVTGFTSNTDGDSNTVGLSTFPSAVTYDASDACYNSTANGRSDWYLPARDELLVLYTNRAAIGNFNLTANYWSSSENSSNNAREVDFVSGATTNLNKNTNILNIRCVRTKNTDLTEVVPSGLVGHWRLDETSGTTAFDSSGNNNNGAVSDTTFAASSTSGMVGKAFNSLDDNDRITVPDSATLNPNTAITVSAWVRSRKESRQRLVMKWGGTDNGYMLWIENSSGPRFEINTAAGNRIAFGGTTIANDDVWHHLVGVYDGSTVSIYLDGVLDGSAGHSGLLVDDDADLYLSGGSGGTYIGGMDDVRIYNRALTEPEILALYEARDGIRYNETANVPEFFNGNKFVPMAQFNDVSNGLVGHWKLDETTGTTAVDSSGNGNDATMSGILDATTDNVPGAVGRALHFQGITTYATVTGSGFPTGSGTPFTMSAWAKSDVFTGMYGTLLLWGRDNDSSYTRPNMRLLEVSGSMYLRVGVGNNIYNDYVLSGYDVNTFEHYTVTYDGTDMEAFRNGVSMGAWTPGSPINAPDDYAVIGARNNGGSYSQLFRGAIDDVRLYSRVLTDDEVMTLYIMGAPYGQNQSLPNNCPDIGDRCDDGTIYAGISPDGSVEMYTTPEDAGLMHWNNDNTNYTDVSGVAGSANAGMSNTLGLVITDSDSVAAGFQTHFAAQYCYDFVFGGNDDWYLPAPNEMLVLYNNRVALGNFDVSGEEYWTSEQGGSNSGRTVIFSNGNLNGSDKHVDERVRCVRKGPAPRCANPYGLEGSMFYNTTHDVMQYCDGGRWVGIGKQN